jgi:hypothetical protein
MKTLARPQDATEIVRRLRMVRPDSARRWGRMTPHQMVCHLIDSCAMALGEKAVSDARVGVPPFVIKCFALYVPVRWPTGLPTRPEIDAERGGTAPAVFDGDVARLEALLEAMTTQAGRRDCPKHPLFGRMAPRDWLRWGYLHADHHLRQFGV